MQKDSLGRSLVTGIGKVLINPIPLFLKYGLSLLLAWFMMLPIEPVLEQQLEGVGYGATVQSQPDLTFYLDFLSGFLPTYNAVYGYWVIAVIFFLIANSWVSNFALLSWQRRPLPFGHRLKAAFVFLPGSLFISTVCYTMILLLVFVLERVVMDARAPYPFNPWLEIPIVVVLVVSAISILTFHDLGRAALVSPKIEERAWLLQPIAALFTAGRAFVSHFIAAPFLRLLFTALALALIPFLSDPQSPTHMLDWSLPKTLFVVQAVIIGRIALHLAALSSLQILARHLYETTTSDQNPPKNKGLDQEFEESREEPTGPEAWDEAVEQTTWEEHQNPDPDASDENHPRGSLA